MAGIFESQTLSGSSLAGESFVKPPAEAVSARAINNLAETATNVYGVVQVNRAAKKIGQMQDSFLDELSENRENINEIEDLKNVSPVEEEAFNSAQARIKTLQEAVSARRLNPTEAMARIESEKRKAMARAPMFADRIRGLTGDRGVSFDAETEQLIKERNDLREAVGKMGGNPDNEAHQTAARRIMAAESEAEYLGSLSKIEGVKASRVAQESINAQIAMQEAIIMEQIESAGGFENLSAAQTSEIITGIQRFKGPNAKNIVSNMIDAMPNVDLALVPPQVLERMEARIAGAADTLEKQLDGTIPKGVFEARLALEEDTVMVNLQKDDPALFNALTVLSKVPANTLSQYGFAEVVSTAMTDYAKSIGLGTLRGTTKSGMSAAGVENPGQIQRNVATNFAEVRSWLEKNKGKADPAFAKTSLEVINNQMDALIAAPREYVPALFDEMISTVNSDGFRDLAAQVDPAQYEKFLDSSKTMLQAYIAENMAPDMNKELNKRVFVGEVVGGEITSPRLRELVTATVTDNGVVRFTANSGLTTEAGIKRAESEAQRLTKMYSNRTAAIARATKNLGGLTDEQISQKDLTLGLFQGAFADIGEPFKTNPDVVDTETPKRDWNIPTTRRDR